MSPIRLTRVAIGKIVHLELKINDVKTIRQKIVAAPGVTVLDVPDTHLYFQSPGEQVFRLIGIGEDLYTYEETAWC